MSSLTHNMSNQSVNSLESKKQKKEDRNIRLQILVFTAFLSNFIFWYDDPQISGFEAAILGVIFIIYLIYMANTNIGNTLFIFTVYISFQKVLAGDFGGRIPMLNFTNLLLIICIASWVSRSFLRGEKVYRLHALDLLIVTYSLLLVVAMLRSEFRHGFSGGTAMAVVTNFKRIIEPFFVYFLFVNNVKERKQVEHIVFAVCTVLFAIGVMGVKQYYMDRGGGTFSDMDKNAITILADQPNQLASYICNYSFYLLAVFIIYIKRWWAWAAGLGFILCFQSVRATFSRGGILSFYIGLALSMLLQFRWKIIFLILPLTFVFVTYPQKVLGPRMYKTYVNVFEADRSFQFTNKVGQAKFSGDISGLDTSAQSRLWIIEAGINRISQDVVSTMFGVGLGLFAFETMGYHEKVMFIDAHNQWLLILVECGSIALLAFMLILVIAFYKAMKIYFFTRDKLYRCVAIGYIAGTMGLVVANFFGSRMNSNEITHFHWIMTAVLLRIDVLVAVERQEFLRAVREKRLAAMRKR